MRKIKLLIFVLVAVLCTVFSFEGMTANATTKLTNKASTTKTTAKKVTSKKPTVKKTTTKKPVSKKKTTTKRTAKKSTKKSKISSKKSSKRRVSTRGKVYSRGSGSVLGIGSTLKVINYAKRYLGVHYSFGSSSKRAFDCSGFTMYIYRVAGINLPHTAAGQANLGLAVHNKSSLQPGDLVFFETYKAGISHVGMYIGNGHFIHASSGAGKVTVTSLSDPYYIERFRGGTRVLND